MQFAEVPPGTERRLLLYERKWLERMLAEEKRRRLTLRCSCGVRLDVIQVVPISPTTPKGLIINNFKQGREQDIRDEIAGRPPRPRRQRSPEGRHFTMQDGSGPACNYKCRKCGRNHALNLDKLRAVAKRRLDYGGKEIVAGVDI